MTSLPRETYEIVDLDGGDVLATYTNHDDATYNALMLIIAEPQMAGDVVVMTFDENHERVAVEEITEPPWTDLPPLAPTHTCPTCHGSGLVVANTDALGQIRREDDA